MMRMTVTVALACLTGAGATLRAQDLETRAYSNSPIGLNFAIAEYAYAKGTVLPIHRCRLIM
jgi:hypothetical protein